MPTQCVSTAVIGTAFCVKRCSSERLARDLAFFPPEPPSYALGEREASDDGDGERAGTSDSGELRVIANEEHVPATYAAAFQRVLDDFRVDLVTTARGNEVVAMTCEAPPTRISAASEDDARAMQDGANLTLIYSHGNAVDAGEVAPFARKLSQQLNCRVVTYDYSGYGQSRGEPSVADTYADIDAVVAHVIERFGVSREESILLGQSIGSGPTCFHAGKRENAGFGAVVLVSPLLSALNVVSSPQAWCTPAKVFRKMDVYKNYQVVKNIQCPILLIHGDQDNVVHVSHGETLWETIRKSAKTNESLLEPYWIRGAGHDDTYDRNPAEFIRRLREVCALVRENWYRRVETAP